MALSDITGSSLRSKVFIGFTIVCIMSIIGATLTSYLILKKTAETHNKTDLQKKAETLISSLDYTVSHTVVTEADLPNILNNKILEIADVNKQDIVIFNLKGQYLISNKDKNLVPQQEIPKDILIKIISSDKRVDVQELDKKNNSNVTSSYIKLKNNMLEPIAIVYLPFYHNDSSYFEVLGNYIQMVILGNLILILFSIWLSWQISNGLTRNIRKISDEITKINLLGKDVKPIKYFNDDELTPLVNSYNKIIHILNEQKELLAFREKESAWREMAKQVAHEVKNPLTPMKLLIQNFERKFDKADPDIDEKVTRLSKTMVDQIDLISTVAGAFSEFAKLPEKKNETLNVIKEIKSLIRVFNDKNEIYFHSNKDNILINFDKIFFSRIITNLITNAQQAVSDLRKPVINIDVELINKKVSISVEDNGVGIPKDKIDKIFEPNFTTKNSGMGLGLTMVRKMVEDYKGEINVKSEEGKGTKFVIILPTNT